MGWRLRSSHRSTAGCEPLTDTGCTKTTTDERKWRKIKKTSMWPGFDNHSRESFNNFFLSSRRFVERKREKKITGLGFGSEPRRRVAAPPRDYSASIRPPSVAPPRCFNRNDDIFLFFSLFSPRLPPAPSLPVRLSSFLFFLSLRLPLRPLRSALKGKSFLAAPSASSAASASTSSSSSFQ